MHILASYLVVSPMWSLGFGKINLEHMYLHQGQRVSSSHRALARYPLRSYTEVGGTIIVISVSPKQEIEFIGSTYIIC